MLLILLIILIVVLVGGGMGWNNGAYRTPGLSLAGLLIIVLLVLLLTGALD